MLRQSFTGQLFQNRLGLRRSQQCIPTGIIGFNFTWLFTLSKLLT